MNSQYDTTLLGILQHEGKIEKFLEVIFSFLMRRTDFYHIMTSENTKLGFPEGVSRRMVMQVFDEYKTIFECYQAKQKELQGKEHAKVSCLKTVAIKGQSSQVSNSDSCSTTSAARTHADRKDVKNEDNNDADPSDYQADSECYNGAVRDDYSWSQTIKDVDIKIKVSPVVKSARNLEVQIQRNRIVVSIKESNDITQPFFDRQLCWDILKDESMWTFLPEERLLHISLEKVQERWWEAAFEGEDKINTRKIDCSRPMHELDDEAQSKIQQLMYDEQCKRSGLPTSEQQKLQKMLSKAWDQEGSPFRGTPYDPSKVDFASSGDMNE